LAAITDTLDEETTYEFIQARIVNNSVNKQYNYVTLNKGRRDGVMPDMGIIGSGGVVVGVVTNVTEHYSSGPSILNRRWFVSSKIKKNNYFGRLAWDGYDYQRAKLNEIPFHVELAVGDTIVTSGYSSIFPEGFLIGTIEEFNHSSGANFYEIIIRLSTDFKTLSHVELVKNNFIEEQTELEELNRND
jgi:rod shape-determining protein MreC